MGENAAPAGPHRPARILDRKREAT